MTDKDRNQIAAALLGARELTSRLILGQKITPAETHALDTKLRTAIELIDTPASVATA